MFLLEPLGIERVVALIPPEHRCLAGIGADNNRSHHLQVACGLEDSASVEQSESRAIIKTKEGSSTVLLPADSTMEYVTGPLDDPANGKGCEGVPARRQPVVISTALRAEDLSDRTRSQELFLLVPEFKVDLRIGRAFHNYCHGSHSPHDRTYRASCTSGENWSHVEVTVAGDALLFSVGAGGYDHDSRDILGGFRLPCGAKVSFPTLHRIDPAHSPPGGICSARCGATGDLCHDRCTAQHSDVETEAGPGALCLGRCRIQEETCDQRCNGR